MLYFTLVGGFSKILGGGGYLFMKFFLSIFSCLLIVFSVVCCPLCVLADTQGGDSVSIGIDFSATSSTGSETVNNYLWGEFVSEWMDEDDSTFTVFDFMSRLSDAYLSYQYAIPSGGATLVKNAIFDAMRDYTFYVNSQTGVVTGPAEFYHDLQEIYERFGYDATSSMIGEWVALPVTYWQNFDGTISPGGSAYDYRSDYAVYTTYLISGGRVSTHLFAIRSSSSVTAQERVHFYDETFGSWTSFNVQTAYTGSEYSGFYGQRGSGRYLVGSNGYSSQSDALADFFGDAQESGDTVWNGNLYYDNTPNPFTLNNARGGIKDAADRYSLLTFLGVEPDDVNLHQYFDGDTTIIYNPNFSDIPNNHDFSYDLPSGTIPELDFEFNYTLEADQGGSFFNLFDGVFNSSGGILVICIVVMGVFLLIEVMT